MAVRITSREELEAWLNDKPKEWAQAIALRAALRVVPIAVDPEDWPRSADHTQLTLSLFQAAVVSFATLEKPAAQEILTSSTALATATTTASVAATTSLGGAVRSAYAAVEAATYAVNAAYVSYAARGAAESAWYAARVAFYADDNQSNTVLWTAIEEDCQTLDVANHPQDLMRKRLWSKYGWVSTPSWSQISWNAARKWLSLPESGFEIWREWYYGRLEGLPHAFADFDDLADETFYRWIVEHDDDWWSREPAIVNAEIKAFVEDLRTGELVPETSVDFFISYANEDEPIAREVASVLDDLGKSYLVQYRDFPQANFVNAMNDAMRRAERLIPLYSADYIASPHCNAEWNYFYSLDPFSAERRIAAFRLDHADLNPLMQPISYCDLAGLPRKDRLQAIREWIEWEPPERTRNTMRDVLSEKLDPCVVKNEAGLLDMARDPDRNAVEVPAELAAAMSELGLMLDLVEDLRSNLLGVLNKTILKYNQHFTENGAESSWGGLDRYMVIINTGAARLSDVDYAEEKEVLGQLEKAHAKCMDALKNADEHKHAVNSVEFDNDNPDGISPVLDELGSLSEKLEEAGISSDAFNSQADELLEEGRDYVREQQISGKEEDLPNEGRKRYLRYVSGFVFTTVTLMGSLATLRATPEGAAILAAGERLVEAVFRMIGI
jgi:hypothetical protein